MRPGTNWRSDAVIRLLLSVLVCIYAGSVLTAVVHYSGAAAKAGPWQFYVVGLSTLVCLGVTLWLVNSRWPLEGPGWRLALRLAFALTLFYTSMFAGAWLYQVSEPPRTSVLQMGIAGLSFQGAVLALAAFFLRQHGLSAGEAFGFFNNGRAAVLAGIVLAILFLPVGWSLQQLSAIVIQHFHPFGIRPDEQQAVQTLRLANSWTQRATLGVVTIALAPAAEETLFRGILYPWVKQAGFPRLALWGTSLLFAAVHFNALTLAPLLMLSLVLTLLYERTANLLAPIATHSVFNALNFGLLYLYGQ